MPYRKTNLRRREHVARLTVPQVEYLLTGHSCNGTSGHCPFATEDAARRVWDDYAEILMAIWLEGPDRENPPKALGLDYAAAHAEANQWTDWNWQMLCEEIGEGRPLTRPWAWWRWNAPEAHRKAVEITECSDGAGKGSFATRVATPDDDTKIWEVSAQIEAQRIKLPWHEAGANFGLPRSSSLLTFESEAQYLDRLGLLTGSETDVLADAPASNAD